MNKLLEQYAKLSQQQRDMAEECSRLAKLYIEKTPTAVTEDGGRYSAFMAGWYCAVSYLGKELPLEIIKDDIQ